MNYFTLLIGFTLSLLSSAVAALKESDFRAGGLFQDGFMVELRAGVTAQEVAAEPNPVLRKLAEDLLAERVQPSARLKTYRAYEPVNELAQRLKTSGYDQFENATGIYFSAEDEAVLVVDGLGQRTLQLRVYDFGRNHADHRYPLRDGLNLIPMKGSGLGYIEYFTSDYAKAPRVKISILSGQVNGVFQRELHDDDDWQRLLSHAVTEVIDIVGERVHLVYPVAQLRESCPERGSELIRYYDEIIKQQHQIMGLEKYDRVPDNRIMGRVIWNGYMHADAMGAAFHFSTMNGIANPDNIPANAWGIAHEFGHVNQTRPGMKWVSTTEVTNNIFSAWTNYLLNPGNMRLEHEVINGGDGNMVGGRFNAFLNSALVAKEQWLCQRGPDKMENYQDGGDHFVKLAPLWQLQLYMVASGHGNPDFYPDIFEKVRLTDETKLSNGDLQLNFMRNACDSAKQDLAHFFKLTGMLQPIDKELDDYTRGQLTITQSQCDQLERYAARYPKPDSPVIFYISANSVDAYKNRAAVEGVAEQGVTVGNGTRTIDHAVWKNVVAFETYQNRELVKVAMVGSGSPDNSSSLVIYPEGATRIEAVSWDGQRTLVTGRR